LKFFKQPVYQLKALNLLLIGSSSVPYRSLYISGSKEFAFDYELNEDVAGTFLSAARFDTYTLSLNII
jgi:hypothetical protein